MCTEDDLSDPRAFRAAFAEHQRSLYATAFRIVGDAALAQDVVQDVFLRLWRRPAAYDPRRGELGPFLRLMARSRALDLWREGQVRGRAAERLTLAGGSEEPRVEADPGVLAERDLARGEVREALARIRLGLARLRDEIPAAA
jgi:RNA polymerase sigma-70 factor (ECF subfamily)